MRAFGAMPEMVPSEALPMVAGTPTLPAAVPAVWLPWPSAPRAEANS